VKVLLARVGFLALCVLVAPVHDAGARPERIRAGHSYYSDDSVEAGLVRDIAAEKNYEEVYQLYGYYEAIYDAAGRVVTFREYKRGDPIRTEEYRYAPDGSLRERIVRRPGEPDEVTRPGGE
jgi:hypothetical protein